MNYIIIHENFQNLELIKYNQLSEQEQETFINDNLICWYNANNIKVYADAEINIDDIANLICNEFDLPYHKTMYNIELCTA